MRIQLFSEVQAMPYMSRFSGSTGDSEQSIELFFDRRIRSSTIRRLIEGTRIFDEYRDCLLRNIERCLFLAVSNYRRSLDLMISSGAPWAHVTLYYGSWYTAHALLGMFGAALFKNHVIDVETGILGSQTLRVVRKGNSPSQISSTYSGSHEKFWDLFYQAFTPIRPMIPMVYQSAFSPVMGDPSWQTQERNRINYDSYHGIQIAEAFHTGFRKNTFPGCLPGSLNTQYRIFEILLNASFYYAGRYGINTDALHGLRTPMTLRNKIRQLIYSDKPCGLVQKTIKSQLV